MASSFGKQFYQKDLAFVHARDFTPIAEAAAGQVLSLLPPADQVKLPVLDLGCGNGTTLKQLCAAGYSAIGIDYSADMIELAKVAVPSAQFQQASIWDYVIPPVHAVLSIGECLNYAFDAQAAHAQLTDLFGRIHSQLADNGFFLFDFLEDRLLDEDLPPRIVETTDWSIFLEYEKDTTRRHLTRHITLFRKINGYYRRSQESHRCRLFDPSAIKSLLETVGFSVEVLSSYGEEIFRPHHIGILAKK